MAGVIRNVDEDIPACDLESFVSSATAISQIRHLVTSTCVKIIFHGESSSHSKGCFGSQSGQAHCTSAAAVQKLLEDRSRCWHMHRPQ